MTTKKNKKVEPVIVVELLPVVDPAVVDPLERLRVAVLTKLAQKFEGKGKIMVADLNAAIQLLKKAGHEAPERGDAPAAAPGGDAQGDREAGSGARAGEGGVTPSPAGQQKGSWTPLTAKEDADMFLPFSNGEPTER